LAINARVPGSNPTTEEYFSSSVRAFGKLLRLLQRYKNAGCGIQLILFFYTKVCRTKWLSFSSVRFQKMRLTFHVSHFST